VALAAGRAGAGLLRLAVPASLQPVVAGRVMEATTLALPETVTPGEVEADGALARLSRWSTTPSWSGRVCARAPRPWRS